MRTARLRLLWKEGPEGQSKMGEGPGQADMRGLDLQVFRVRALADQVDGLMDVRWRTTDDGWNDGRFVIEVSGERR